MGSHQSSRSPSGFGCIFTLSPLVCTNRLPNCSLFWGTFVVSFRACQIAIFSAVLIASPAFAARTHRSATSGHTIHHRRHVRHRFVPGQRHIEPERAREIQDALIREHYLNPPASGEWDAATETAMQKYQADHGWQTKLTPDSRALIKLGLGPHDDSVPPSPATTGSAAAGDPAPAALPASGSLAEATTSQN
jgi:hypothetical protein